MDKKIAVVTWVTDDYVDYIGLNEIRNSFKYFHPDVDFFVFDTAMTNKAKEIDPWLNPVWMKPPCAFPYMDDYDMVVQIDGDCVVTGPMTELFESDEDVIGVRNNNSFDKASSGEGITIRHLEPFGNNDFIPVQGFINAGLIACNNKEFWKIWHSFNKEACRIKVEENPYAHGIGDEQDTLNQLFHSGRYSSKIIDAMGTGVSYGLCNTWGTETHWDSWKDLYVEDDCLYLDDPVDGAKMKVKVLHQAGGSAAAQLNKSSGGLREWMKTVMSTEALNYINKITS
tara:strand:- start:257 stop:1108 length:852 start_codon:yes stop_codon:yes gene_type:complete